MCFGVSLIKLFLNSCSLKNLINIQTQRLAAEYNLVCKYLWSYDNDAICMKKFYEAFKQIKLQDKYFLKDFLLCYLFKLFVNKHWLTWSL